MAGVEIRGRGRELPRPAGKNLPGREELPSRRKTCLRWSPGFSRSPRGRYPRRGGPPVAGSREDRLKPGLQRRPSTVTGRGLGLRWSPGFSRSSRGRYPRRGGPPVAGSREDRLKPGLQRRPSTVTGRGLGLRWSPGFSRSSRGRYPRRGGPPVAGSREDRLKPGLQRKPKSADARVARTARPRLRDRGSPTRLPTRRL